MKVYSRSQGKVIDMPEGGTTPSAGMGVTPQTNQTDGGGLLGGNEQIYNALMMLGLGKAGSTGGGRILQQAQYFKPPKTTESETKRGLEKTRAASMSKQMDTILNKWEKIPAVERLPIPGMGRVSETRASYEGARDAFNYFVITLAADKRITDQERQYWLKQFPPLLASKGVAKTKINELKNFINAYAGIESPTNQEAPTGISERPDLSSFEE
jgi:hypothetical protein